MQPNQPFIPAPYRPQQMMNMAYYQNLILNYPFGSFDPYFPASYNYLHDYNTKYPNGQLYPFLSYPQSKQNLIQEDKATGDICKIENVQDEAEIKKEVFFEENPVILEFQNEEIPSGIIKGKHIHKNFESNVINQVLSFLWIPVKNLHYIRRVLKTDAEILSFNKCMYMIRKQNQKSMSKQVLFAFFDFEQKLKGYKKFMKFFSQEKNLSLEKFLWAIKILVRIFFDEISSMTFLTSKRLRSEAKKEHFQKARNLRSYIFGKISQSQYEKRLYTSYTDIYDHEHC